MVLPRISETMMSHFQPCVSFPRTLDSIPVDLDPEQDYGVLEEGAKHEEDAGYYPRLKQCEGREMIVMSEN